MSRSTGHEQVGRLGQVEHKHLVGNRLTDGTGQFHLRLLELLRIEDRFHRYRRRLGIRNLDTHRTLAGHRRDDTNAEGCQRQGDIVLQILHLLDSYALSQRDLVEGDCRSDGGLDARDLHTKGAKHIDDSVLVGRLLGHVDIGLTVVIVFLQQVERRVVVVLQVTLRIVGLQILECRGNGLLVCSLVSLGLFHAELHIIVCIHRLFRRSVNDRGLWCVGLIHLVDDDRLTIRHKLHRLGGGVVEHLRIVLCLGLFVRLFLRVDVCDIEFYLIEELGRIQNSTDHEDSLSTQVGEEGDGRQGKDGRQTGRSHDVTEVMADV